MNYQIHALLLILAIILSRMTYAYTVTYYRHIMQALVAMRLCVLILTGCFLSLSFLVVWAAN